MRALSEAPWGIAVRVDSVLPLAGACLAASWLEEYDLGFWQRGALAVHEELLRCGQASQG